MAKKEKPQGANNPRSKRDPPANAGDSPKKDPPTNAGRSEKSDSLKKSASGNPGQAGKPPADKPQPEEPPADKTPAKTPAVLLATPAATKPNGPVVVGIGASAGGLESFKKFFDVMPADTGLAFVLIQHLDPTHESMMVELLAKHTKMQVSQVTQGTLIEPNRVYIAPAGKYVGVRNRAFMLSEPIERRGLRMPIDHFFRSMAEDLRERAICVILSGTGTEGTLGLRAVKEQGGMAMVQEPASAPHDSMPRSAISTNLVDFIIPVEEMPEVLIRYTKHPYLDGPTKPEIEPPKGADHLNAILAVIKARTHQDFRSYKKSTLTRRIERRMGLNHILDADDYVEYLRNNSKEVTQLFKDLLIGVTGFFRESEAWDALIKQVIPNLVSTCARDAPVRLWVPGCSTGEEAYSLVMVLLDEVAKQEKSCPIQVFATDIDEEALEFARGGIYPESIAADVPPDKLRRYFSKVDDHNYKVNKPLREPVVFALQNLIGDAPFSKLDLISCRNLLIYLEANVQQKVISLFHFGLKPGGYLFLGTSEGINRQEALFEPVSKKWQIYRRIGPSHPDRIEFPITVGAEGLSERRAMVEIGRRPSMAEITQQALLQEFAPATVLVNHKFEVLFLTGPTSLYLELPPGAPTLDIMTLAQEGLRGKLRAALAEASKSEGRATARGGRVKRDDTYIGVTIGVRPVNVPQQEEPLLLVTFVDEPKPVHEATPSETSGSPEYTHLRQLEHDLQTTREDLQTTIEELETSNEELKVSNEEIMSMNEELQSTNEELETSKEELQSLNEELSTVNSQLQEKVSQLESTNNDMANLLSNTDVSTLFLDTGFRIRRYTPAATHLFKVIPSDIGRPIDDIATLIKDGDLLEDAKRVLDKLMPQEREVHTADGQYYLRRIVPYRTQDNRIDGVVITFANVSPIKKSEESLRSLAGTLEQQVAERTALLELVQEVTQAANEADRPDQVVAWTLERIGKFNDWPVGVGYLVDGGTAHQLEPIEIWHAEKSNQYEPLVQATLARRPTRGEVLPGLTWERGELVTIKDITKNSGLVRRKEATSSGLHGALAFPILIRKEVVGVLEFFVTTPLDRKSSRLNSSH